MWSTSDPVVREWIERNLGPIGRLEDAAQSAGALVQFVGELPGLLARAGGLLERIDAITRNGHVLSPESVDAIARAQADNARWKTAGLWAIALILFWIAWMLM
jgi:ubiquinone biosynthesis protein